MRPFAKTLLRAFTILMGLDLGAGLYEARVNVAGWSTAIVGALKAMLDGAGGGVQTGVGISRSSTLRP